MTVKELIALEENGVLVYHHTGGRGCESRKGNGHVEKYDGKFGKGFVWIKPRFYTTRYVDVAYYLDNP